MIPDSRTCFDVCSEVGRNNVTYFCVIRDLWSVGIDLRQPYVEKKEVDVLYG